jgi:hypothetical protein
MALADELEEILSEARMRDVRRHQVKPASGAQVDRAFKETMHGLGALASKLSSAGHRDLARQVDDMAGQVRGIQKRVGPM